MKGRMRGNILILAVLLVLCEAAGPPPASASDGFDAYFRRFVRAMEQRDRAALRPLLAPRLWFQMGSPPRGDWRDAAMNYWFQSVRQRTPQGRIVWQPAPRVQILKILRTGYSRDAQAPGGIMCPPASYRKRHRNPAVNDYQGWRARFARVNGALQCVECISLD